MRSAAVAIPGTRKTRASAVLAHYGDFPCGAANYGPISTSCRRKSDLLKGLYLRKLLQGIFGTRRRIILMKFGQAGAKYPDVQHCNE